MTIYHKSVTTTVKCLFVLLCVLTARDSAANVSAFTEKADQFLRQYVKDGNVAYGAIKSNFKAIASLYQEVGQMNLEGVPSEARKSFYINAYNIVVIYSVVKHLPLESPLDHAGFFDKVQHKVAGEMLTLNTLEVEKLLKVYKDARIHFVLVCAAKSCPPLAGFAYTPDKLDGQLTARTKLSLNDSTWLRLIKAQKKVELSKIFEWYAGDFTQNGQSVIEWINTYRTEKIPAGYTVAYYEYDWRLNE
jgi:hypothetical protein